jgi:hypothetical protein
MCFLLMNTLIQFYALMKSEKKKERFDIILEPLQAVTQLALLSFCPKGSKLAIANNLLMIQEPSWVQGLWRSYNHDMKEDLFFLFNAIVRFNRFYSFLKTESDEYCDVFDLLVQLGKRGIDKLLQTYATTEQPALLHTLQLYRILLEKPVMFTEAEELEVNKMHGTNSIDDIFIQIRTLYTSHEFILLYQALLLLEKHPERYDVYIKGINTMVAPVHDQIQKWISDHIVY